MTNVPDIVMNYVVYGFIAEIDNYMVTTVKSVDVAEEIGKVDAKYNEEQMTEGLLCHVNLDSKKKGFEKCREIAGTLILNFIYRSISLFHKAVYYYFLPNMLIVVVFAFCTYNDVDMGTEIQTWDEDIGNFNSNITISD